MRLEKNRHIQIALHFMHNGRMITSEELASLTKASARTIKSDIAIINDALQENGCRILSKKSEGYQLVVTDQGRYEAYKTQLEIINHYSDSDQELSYMLRVSEIIRELLSSNDYTNIDELAEKMYMSRSTIKQDLQKVRKYLESYSLQLETKPNYGMRVVGKERHFRMAMMSAYGINIPTVQRNLKVEQYRKQLEAEDYDAVRHTTLDVLRKEKYSIKDNASQGLSRYLMVMRSRIKLNYGHIIFDEKTRKELASFKIQSKVTGHLFKELQCYEGFDVSEDEKRFITMYLIAYHDYEGAEITENVMQFFFKDTQKMFYEACEYIKSTLGLEDNFTRTKEQLFYNVCRIVVRNHFHMLPYDLISYSTTYEDIKNNPVAINLASYLASYLEERLFCRLNVRDILYLAHYFNELLNQILFPYQPQRLLTVSGIGKNYAQLMIDKIDARYGRYVKSNAAMELYEIRPLTTNEVDLVVLDNLSFAYRYDIPYVTVDRNNLDNLKEELKRGFLLHQVYEEIRGMLKVYRNYEFRNAEDCFRILSYKYGVDELSVNEMIHILKRHEERISYGRFGFAVLLADYRFVRKNCIEIYQLKTPMTWYEGTSVSHVLFVAADFTANLKLMKAVSYLISSLYEDEALMEELFEEESRSEVILAAILKQIQMD